MKRESDKNIFILAKSIFKEYILCGDCLGRQFPYFRPNLSSRQKGLELLQSISKNIRAPSECYLCEGLMSSAEARSREIAETLRSLEFDSLLVGSKFPAKSVDKEDHVRSEFKLRGGKTLKAEFTRELGRNVATLLGKRLTYSSPDMVAIFDPLKNSLRVIPKSLYIFGRYVKRVRGLPQKQTFSEGASVESILATRLLKHFGGRSARFSWIGGEDDDSLVLGQGRPFYAELFEPTKRSLGSMSKLAPEEDQVALQEIRIVKDKPPAKAKFKVTVLAEVEFESFVTEDQLNTLQSRFKDAVLTALSTRKGKFAEKKVYDLEIKDAQGKEAKVMIRCDGGLNIKKFISGSDHEISPSISEVLGIGAHCKQFDVLAVDLLDATN